MLEEVISDKTEKFIIIETILNAGFSIILSVVNGNTYTIVEDCRNFKNAVDILVKLNKDYKRLILDIGYHENTLKYFIDNVGLKYSIENPTRDQIHDMNTQKLSLIELYIEGRHLIRNDSLI